MYMIEVIILSIPESEGSYRTLGYRISYYNSPSLHENLLLNFFYMGTTKSTRQYMAAHINERQTKTMDEFGNKIVGTVPSSSPFTDSRHTRRHPYKFRCTLHTKRWTKSRINHYANIFSQAVKTKKTSTPMEKKTFVQSLINLFA